MMRGHLGGHRESGSLGLADQLDGGGGGDVLAVVTATGESHQGKIPPHHHLLGEGRYSTHPETRRHRTLVHVPAPRQTGILGVLSHYGRVIVGAQRGEVLHGAPQQPGVAHRIAIVGEDSDTRFPQFVEMGEGVTPPSEGDATCRHDLCQPGVPAPLLHVAGEVTAVDRGIGVGHRHQSGEPPGRGGGRPRCDVLLPLLSRLAEVGVQVHQPGPHPAPGDVDGVLRFDPGLDRGHHSPGDGDVSSHGASRPEDRPSFQDQVSHCDRPAT